MEFTLVKPTKIFQLVSTVSISIFFSIVVLLFFSKILAIVFDAFALVLLFSVLTAFFCKKYSEVGTMKCYSESIEISLIDGKTQIIDTSFVTSISVVAYRGGRVGLTINPDPGISNTIKFKYDGAIFEYNFRIESKPDKERIGALARKWKANNSDMKLIKPLID